MSLSNLVHHHIIWDGLGYFFIFESRKNYKTKIFLSTLKISKTFVFLLTMSGEYLTRYGQGFVFKEWFPWEVDNIIPSYV